MMLNAKDFLKEIHEKNIIVKPVPGTDTVEITVNKNFLKHNIYNPLEFRVKEYVAFVTVSNDIEEVIRVHCDEEKDSFFTKKQAKKYAESISEDLNNKLKYYLKLK